MAINAGHTLSVVLQFLLAGVLAFAVISLLTSYLRFQLLAEQVPEDEHETSDDAFQMKVFQRMGSVHRSPEPFGLLFVEFVHPPDASELQQLANDCRTMLRRSDDLVHAVESGYLAILVECDPRHIAALAKRLQGDLAFRGGNPRGGVRLSAVLFPYSGSRYVELLEKGLAGWDQIPESQAGVWIDVPPKASDEQVEPQEQDHLLDELTGILRPDKLHSALQKYVARFRKEARRMTLLYLDVDYLERYNRHYGREGGDAVLKQLGKLIETRFREKDLVGRYDGEEFLVAIDADQAGALKAAQRFCAEVKKYPFAFGTQTLKITTSIGVAGLPDHGLVPRDLFNSASAALLAAKNRGRGHAVLFEKGMPSFAELQSRTEKI